MKNVLVVAIGGVVGSLARWALSFGWNDHGFAWGTLIVNYVGSVLLAILVVYSDAHRSPKWWWRPALGAGFCGGFTTYSAFALRVDQYLNEGNYLSAISYTLASLIGSYLFVFVTVKIMTSKQVQR